MPYTIGCLATAFWQELIKASKNVDFFYYLCLQFVKGGPQLVQAPKILLKNSSENLQS
jgi:hypothetical protein